MSKKTKEKRVVGAKEIVENKCDNCSHVGPISMTCMIYRKVFRPGAHRLFGKCIGFMNVAIDRPN